MADEVLHQTTGLPDNQFMSGQWHLPYCDVYQVGAAAGGECFLVVTKNGASFLVDSGYAWDAPQTYARIQAVLGEGAQVDWLLLTHSHYDHCAGAGYLERVMPDMKVLCSEYAAYVFTRPGALRTMNELNADEAKLHGLTEFEQVPDHLRIDRVVKEGDVIEIGGRAPETAESTGEEAEAAAGAEPDMRLQVLDAPGHTKCCIAFWEPSLKFLISCETACVYAGPLPEDFADIAGKPAPENVKFMTDPCYLVGFEESMAFISRAQDLQPEVALIPHYGIMAGQQATDYFVSAQYFSWYAARLIVDAHLQGFSDEEVVYLFKREFYNEYVRSIQPEAAFNLNASYMIPMTIREICGRPKKK